MKKLMKVCKTYRIEQELLLLILLILLVLTVMAVMAVMDADRPAEVKNDAAVLYTSAEPVNQYEGIIRLHVIANSDSPEDQELKLKVRNQILSKIQNHMTDIAAAELVRRGRNELDSMTQVQLTRQYILENLEQIETWAADAIEAEGRDYPVEGMLEVTWIPEKEYDGIYFPAGNYEALNLVIGEGKGRNWWCVLYPPLCLVDAGGDIYEDRLAAASASMENLYGNRIILKSRIMEILGKKVKT